ncbi:MAG: RNA methyltransferase [Candidatus Nanohaloarchaea archaeon]
MKAVVVVEPEIPENTGFIARLAANFDFQLRLVNPDFNLSEARSTASGAQQRLREAEIYSSVEEAIDGLDYVVGTKPGRGIALEDFEPRSDTSIMIGRESSGLTNKELDMCDATVHIQTSGYESLNQSHAAAIFMHRLSGGGTEGASSGQKQKLEDMLGDSVLRDVLLRANPSEEELNRVIGELRERKD